MCAHKNCYSLRLPLIMRSYNCIAAYRSHVVSLQLICTSIAYTEDTKDSITWFAICAFCLHRLSYRAIEYQDLSLAGVVRRVNALSSIWHFTLGMRANLYITTAMFCPSNITNS
jgi:hypothetical protein